MELRVSSYGQVRPINWVELEQYLLGVVPAELGPEVWPQLEALRAQAIAARTYALDRLAAREGDDNLRLAALERALESYRRFDTGVQAARIAKAIRRP